MADETKRKRGRPTGPGTNNLNLRVEPDLPLGTYWFRYFGRY